MNSLPDPRPADGAAALHPVATVPSTEDRLAVPAGAYDPEHQSPFARRLVLRRRFDAVLGTLAVAFALVLASTPIRNSDVWMHMASGRALIDRASGAAPRAGAAAEASGPSSTWLFDVGCFTIYTVAGGIGLALVRVLLAAALAGAVLGSGWTGAGAWVATVFTTLAVIAVGPRLQLQPFLVSLLALALTVAYLERRVSSSGDTSNTAVSATWTSFWPLYALFVLWTNIDGWFILGPLALTCYWLGDRFTTTQAHRVPGMAVIAAFASCVVNPHTCWAFRLPAELALRIGKAELAQDSIFRGLFVSPLQADYYQAGQAWNRAGLALALLLLAAVAGLALRPAGRHGPRLLLLTCLLALGIYQARNLPFLAVALAAVTPRILRECVGARFQGQPGAELRLRQALTGRFGTIVAGFALLALAWFGGMQPGRPEPPAWSLEVDPSLEQCARDLAAWHADAKFTPGACGFNYSLDVANYCAWFCPQEKTVFDGRLQGTLAAGDFVTVRQGLTGDARAGKDADWRAILRREHVDHLILADRDRARMRAVLQYVQGSPQEWAVLFQAGRVLVVGWRDAASAGESSRSWPAVDFNYLGLHPERADETSAPRAEQRSTPAWQDILGPRPAPPSLDRDEAMLDLLMFDAQRLPTLLANAQRWEQALVAAAIGQGSIGGIGAPYGAALRLGWLVGGRVAAALPEQAQVELPPAALFALHLHRGAQFERDAAPPGYLWRAVRASHRALAVDADDASALLLLGEAYVSIMRETAERAWTRRLPRLVQLHRLQAINALQRAVRLDPDRDQAHGYLVNLYEDLNYPGLAARHLRAYQRIQRERGPQLGEPLERFAQRMASGQKAADQLEQRVAQREEIFEKQQEGLDVAGRARLLEKLGLAERALTVLLDTDVAAFGKEGMAIELELLLATGRADEARAWLEPKHEAFLGTPDYAWTAARLAAIAGDYAGADRFLQKLQVRAVPVPELGSDAVDLEQALAVSVALNVAGGVRQTVTPRVAVGMEMALSEPFRRLQRLAHDIGQSARFGILRGALDLERGDTALAAIHFRRALALTRQEADGPTAVAAVRNIHPIAAYFVELLAERPGTRN